MDDVPCLRMLDRPSIVKLVRSVSKAASKTLRELPNQAVPTSLSQKTTRMRTEISTVTYQIFEGGVRGRHNLVEYGQRH